MCPIYQINVIIDPVILFITVLESVGLPCSRYLEINLTLSGFNGWIQIQLVLDINPTRSGYVSRAAAIIFYSVALKKQGLR